jgi:branched-chain amino acid transport system permease protein
MALSREAVGDAVISRPSRRRTWRGDPQLRIGLVFIVLSILAPAVFGSVYWSHVFLLLNLYFTVAIFQNLLISDAGQVSFGQGAVFGLAAYTVGIVSGLHGAALPVGFLAGIAAGLILGCLYALPALRVRGFYLGFVTISAAVVMPEMLIAFSSVTNGINGISLRFPELHEPLLLGLNGIGLAILVLSAGSLLAHRLLRETSVGRRMRVAAASPEAALSLGYRPGAVRSLAFVIAGFGSALAGVLYAPLLGFLSPDAFHFDLSIFFFFAVIVGGSGHLLGPIVGAAILYLVPNVLLVDLVNYRLIGYGLVALVIMLLCPDGVVGSLVALWKSRFQRSRAVEVSIVPLIEAARQRAPFAQNEPGEGTAVAVANASKAFGQVRALDGVSLTVRRGTIHGLVGPNGSGKTTMLNMLSGFGRLDGGTISILGRDTTRLSAERIAQLGVGRTFQTPRIFDDLSVWTNFQIGADGVGKGYQAWSLSAMEPYRESWQAAMPDMLPHAQRRILEVMRVVALEPKVLLLDEPAAGLSGEERRQFADLLRNLRDTLGYSIVLVEHDLHLVWRVADHITVLDAGHIVDDGEPQRIVSNPMVRALFTGERHA